MAAEAGVWRSRQDRGIYVLWIALIAAALILGFGADFFRYLAEQPPPPLILHIHGLAYTIWLVLAGVQIFLVEKGNVRLHMRLGWAAVIFGAVMAPLGVVAALVDEARRIHHADSDPHFLALEFGDMLAFAVLFAAGVLLRRDPAAHKRLMILSAVALSDAGFGRISTGLFNIVPTGPLVWWLTYYGGVALILLAMIGWDLRRHGRAHPALIAGAAFLWIEEAAAACLYFTPGWKALMTALVKAWGWVG